MHQAQLTLHLAELDGYHGKLVPTMLEMLRPRLARAWRTVAEGEGEADAVLVDLDSLRGRQLADERAGAGLGARTLALGSDEAAGIAARMLHKPLRLHALLAALCAIEAGDALPAALAPGAAPPPCTVAPRYRMPAWPDLDARSASPARLRILALLERSALDAPGASCAFPPARAPHCPAWDWWQCCDSASACRSCACTPASCCSWAPRAPARPPPSPA
jgi:hypothetical protein